MKTDKNIRKKYWDKNIEKFGKFYVTISAEDFDSNRLIKLIYQKTILPIESSLMKRRYGITINFIKQHVKKGMKVADIGCGTGIFSVEMLKRGANVVAIDYAESAINLTEKLVFELAPHLRHNINYVLMDVTESKIPVVDIALVMGVTPHIEDLSAFLGNILPAARKCYCLMLDPDHWANVIRRFVPILNVRRVHFFKKEYANNLYRTFGYKLISRQSFATGYLDLVAKI